VDREQPVAPRAETGNRKRRGEGPNRASHSDRSSRDSKGGLSEAEGGERRRHPRRPTQGPGLSWADGLLAGGGVPRSDERIGPRRSRVRVRGVALPGHLAGGGDSRWDLGSGTRNRWGPGPATRPAVRRKPAAGRQAWEGLPVDPGEGGNKAGSHRARCPRGGVARAAQGRGGLATVVGASRLACVVGRGRRLRGSAGPRGRGPGKVNPAAERRGAIRAREGAGGGYQG